MSNININKKINNLKSSNLDWNLIQNEMKTKLDLDIYESWLKKFDLVEEFNNYILFSVPTRFIRDWITSRYLDQILQIIKNYKKEIIRVEFKIVEKNFDKDQLTNKINLIENEEQKQLFKKYIFF